MTPRRRLALWPTDAASQVRRVPVFVLALLCATLTLTAATVNRARLHDPTKNRYYSDVFRWWNHFGFFGSAGLWLKEIDPQFYQRREHEPRLYSYEHSSTGFIIPAYLIDRTITLARGRPSVFAAQLYSQLIVLGSAYLLAALSLRAGLRRGLTPAVAGTLAGSCALVFQNFLHNLAMAQEILPTAVSILLMLLIMDLRDRAWDARGSQRRTHLAIVAAMFWMGLSDLIIVPGFFALAVGLLSFFGIGEQLSLRRWLTLFVAPVVLAFAVFQCQLAFGQVLLGVPPMGTSETIRMGLHGRDTLGLGGHWMILTVLRDRWPWWGFGGLALAGLIAVLIGYRDPRDRIASAALMHLLPPVLTYLFLAAMFSEMVLIHPYIYDMFLIVTSVLIVCVHAPLLITRVYPNHGLVALAVLMFSVMYVWISIVDYAIRIQS